MKLRLSLTLLLLITLVACGGPQPAAPATAPAVAPTTAPEVKPTSAPPTQPPPTTVPPANTAAPAATQPAPTEPPPTDTAAPQPTDTATSCTGCDQTASHGDFIRSISGDDLRGQLPQRTNGRQSPGGHRADLGRSQRRQWQLSLLLSGQGIVRPSSSRWSARKVRALIGEVRVTSGDGQEIKKEFDIGIND